MNRLRLISAFLALTVLAPAVAGDGVVEINQTRALKGGVTPGDTPGFPVTISEPGSYRLTSNLDVRGEPNPEDVTAIEIEVKNGSVVGMGAWGLFLLGSRVTISNVRVAMNGSSGTSFQYGMATDVIVELNNQDGIGSSRDASFQRVRVSANGTNGMFAGDRSLVIDGSALDNGEYGLQVESDASYVGNVLSGNGIGPILGSGIQLGPNTCDGSLCP